MDENTRLVVIATLSTLTAVLGGGGAWAYFTEKMKRATPTRAEITEEEMSSGKLSLEIANSLRADMERLRKEILEERNNCRSNIEAIRVDNKARLDEMETLYKKRILELKQEYEEKLREGEEEARELREKIRILEEEWVILLGLKQAYEKAVKEGTISD